MVRILLYYVICRTWSEDIGQIAVIFKKICIADVLDPNSSQICCRIKMIVLGYHLLNQEVWSEEERRRNYLFKQAPSGDINIEIMMTETVHKTSNTWRLRERLHIRVSVWNNFLYFIF